MAGLNEDAQWIVLMGFVVSFSFFFLAMVLNQSTIVGQTTAEAVIEFPKNDIRDVRDIITESTLLYTSKDSNKITKDQATVLQDDIESLALSRKGAVVWYTPINEIGIPTATDPRTRIEIHYNNGVTAYNETWTSS
jgi:hypothetical protein